MDTGKPVNQPSNIGGTREIGTQDPERVQQCLKSKHCQPVRWEKMLEIGVCLSFFSFLFFLSLSLPITFVNK